MTSKKTSTVQCRQCARAGAHWYDFTRCNHQSRDRALQYHNPARNAAATAVSACPSPALARAVSCWPIAHLGRSLDTPDRRERRHHPFRLALDPAQSVAADRAGPSWALQSPQITTAGLARCAEATRAWRSAAIAPRPSAARLRVPICLSWDPGLAGTPGTADAELPGMAIIRHSGVTSGVSTRHSLFAICYLPQHISGRRCSV